MTFPSNVVDEIVGALKRNLPDHNLIRRPVKLMDMTRTIGVFALDWNPDERSQQIGQEEPTTQRYNFRVQNFVKSANEEHGLAEFALDAKLVRVVLYRDTQLRVALSSLQEELLGTVERVLKYSVQRQRFANNETRNSSFVYVAQTDFFVETEAIKLT